VQVRGRRLNQSFPNIEWFKVTTRSFIQPYGAIFVRAVSSGLIILTGIKKMPRGLSLPETSAVTNHYLSKARNA
jgi:hypothetical protein